MGMCLCCGKSMVQRDSEADHIFKMRKYCSHGCAIKARRPNRDNSRFFVKDPAVEKRAEKLVTGKIANSILDHQKVRDIRELNRDLGFSPHEIAEIKGYKLVTVQAVLRRKTWRHVV